MSGIPQLVTLDGTPAFEDVEIVPQGAASSLRLRLVVHETGESSVTLREDLPVDAATTRICIHATSGDPAALGCADHANDSSSE